MIGAYDTLFASRDAACARPPMGTHMAHGERFSELGSHRSPMVNWPVHFSLAKRFMLAPADQGTGSGRQALDRARVRVRTWGGVLFDQIGACALLA